MIFVIGMGKSGTSALSGLLHNNGIVMGEKMLGSGGDENPKGFYENLYMKKINDLILGNWKIKEWNYKKNVVLKDYKTYINDIITIYNSKYEKWGFKDPRLCLTFSQWLNVIKIMGLQNKIKVIFIFRHPGSTGKSLIKYSKVNTMEWAIECWYFFNWKIINVFNIYNIKALYIKYENLVNNIDETCSKISDYLQMHIKNNGFIDSKLNRNENKTQLPEKIKGFYDTLCTLT